MIVGVPGIHLNGNVPDVDAACSHVTARVKNNAIPNDSKTSYPTLNAQMTLMHYPDCVCTVVPYLISRDAEKKHALHDRKQCPIIS